MHWVPVSRTDTYQKPWYTVYDNIGCNAESFKSNRPGLQKKPTKCWRINTKRISQKTGKVYGVHTRWPMTMPLLNQKIKGSGSQQLYPTNIFWVWRAKKIGPESSPTTIYYYLYQPKRWARHMQLCTGTTEERKNTQLKLHYSVSKAGTYRSQGWHYGEII